MSIYDVPVRSLDGGDASLRDYEGKVLLVVNVASKCGLTPQYAGLERLHEKFGERGFAVLGFPCNQFGAQEPGDAEEISTFCSANYGITFPLFEKADVNGPDRQPLYDVLTPLPDNEGNTGDIRWNFEKFLVDRNGEPVLRFSPLVEPESDEVLDAIENLLAAS
ncbi:MAG TPA: glutathione peroxidase [Ilumatobacteraceae bacterium]|nr:glutathione peroxidase [Ilumatobacteraceae bacterium]